MAFKMKGSAFKLGNVATKSALKDTGASKLAAKEKNREYNPRTKQWYKKPITDADRAFAAKHDGAHANETKENPAHRILSMKSPAKQTFGYHDEEGNVIADATKDIVPAKTGVSKAVLPEGDDPNTKMIRQTARNKAMERSNKRAEKLKKKRLKREKKEAAKKSKGEKRKIQISVRGFVKPKAKKGGGTKMVPSFPTIKVRKVKKDKPSIRVSRD